MGKYKKEYVEYEPTGRYHATKGQRCGNCPLFDGVNKCSAVEGRVEYDGHCVIWKPTTDQRYKERWK